ncbi:Histone demethylase JHD2 [Candida viswanathii]|uniref:Histone demethylase JHD2 n=1 Tax=Candida viswanathii TaxID=5486 RepID=A0A367XYT5_9ASCO|nr:Histone demethylase JHD2 [Candida viswanathii]
MSFNKSLLTPCPVLTPNEEEFNDPVGYLSSAAISELGATYGIVKIVPPPNWKPSFHINPDFKFHVRKQVISDLGITTRSRDFFRENINRFLKMRRKRQLKLFFEVEGTKVYYYDLYRDVEEMGEPMDEPKWQALSAKFGVDLESIKREYENSIKYYANYLHHNTSYEFPDSDSEDEYDNCLICGQHDHPLETLLCDNCDNPFHMKCLNPPLTVVPATNWYCDKCLIGTGEYGFDEDVDVKYTIPEFYKMCQEFDAKFAKEYNDGKPLTVDAIEEKFWSFVDIEKSDLEVMYGADIHNSKPGEISGFPMSDTPNLDTSNPLIQYYINHPCNLNKLPLAKGSLLNFIDTSISGMTIPWIYVGSLLSTFCWHVEDHYTLSANYCHFGATKKWYGIPSVYADKFEKLMKDAAPDLFKRQPDLLHQLVSLMSPTDLVANGIPCVYADQNPNEFVVTYPRVYHAGFNCGFNFNEAVNFATDSWLEFGEKSVRDYRPIKKENVFNHNELMENILVKYNKDRDVRVDLVRRSLNSFEKFVKSQSELLSRLKGKFEVEVNHHEIVDEECLCDYCKTHLSYQYCILLPKKPHRRIAITQLLTPESSPQDAQLKKEMEQTKVDELANSEASQNLSKLNREPVAELDEFQSLIEKAKQESKTKEEKEAAPARRRSKRLLTLKEKEEPPKKRARMGKITKKKEPNAPNREPRLCLQCVCSLDEKLQHGKLIYRKQIPVLEELINETRKNLE